MPDHPHTIDRWDEATGENLIERIAGVSGLLGRGRDLLGGGEALAEGFESGAVMYINKPFTAHKLLTIVNTMLEAGRNL